MFKISKEYRDFIKNLSIDDMEKAFKNYAQTEKETAAIVKEAFASGLALAQVLINPKVLDGVNIFKNRLRTIMLILVTTKELPQNKLLVLNNVLNMLVSRSDKIELSKLLLDFNSVTSTIEGTAEKLYKLWQNTPPKENHIKIGDVTLSFASITISPMEVELVKSAIQRTGQLMAQSNIPHFKEAFYGDMLLLDNAGRAVEAYYSPNNDSIWISKKAVSSPDNLAKALLHELGHRYYQHILTNQQKASWKEFFELLSILSNEKTPKVGDSIFFDWGVFLIEAPPGKDTITKIERDANGLPQYVVQNPDNKATVRVSFANLSKHLFPTNYAKTDPEEFFCETISHYCLGKLKNTARALLSAHFEHNFVVVKRDLSNYLLDGEGVVKYYDTVPENLAKRLVAQANHVLNMEMDPREKEKVKEFHVILESYKDIQYPWFLPRGLMQEFLSIYNEVLDQIQTINSGKVDMVSKKTVEELQEKLKSLVEGDLSPYIDNRHREQIVIIRELSKVFKALKGSKYPWKIDRDLLKSFDSMYNSILKIYKEDMEDDELDDLEGLDDLDLNIDLDFDLDLDTTLLTEQKVKSYWNKIDELLDSDGLGGFLDNMNDHLKVGKAFKTFKSFGGKHYPWNMDKNVLKDIDTLYDKAMKIYKEINGD